MLSQVLNHLKLPPAEFRGTPFWSWNGKLEESELRRQIRVMHEMGFGGFFMHARTGLNTKYLGKEWFRCVNACIDEAGKLGMKAWLYDEDRYASGSAGGLVGDTERFRSRKLRYEVGQTPEYRAGDLAWFAGNCSGIHFDSPRRIEAGDALQPGESFLRFYVELSEKSSWNNGGYFPDRMNAEAMREFIRLTHEEYAAHCSAEFGKTVPGIFSDEPSCSNWTDGMEEKFRCRYGIDLLAHLPELFFVVDGQECSRIRWQFTNLRAELLEHAFAEQVHDWCATHDLQFTGHVLGEDSVIFQTQCVGSAMRFVENMDVPGVDLLGECWMSFDAMIQTASVAHQTGKKRTICETFAGCGWDFPLASQKAVADWQAALGITSFCQHLAFYTMEGEAKRDYPPSFLDQSPWHPVEKPIQDYFARLGALLSDGEAERNILVVHPLESTWFWKPLSSYTPEETKAETVRLPRLRNALLSAKLGFDYGDEEMMERLGSEENGVLRVGVASYRLLILPEMRTVRISTLRLAERFAEHGGDVLYLGSAPEFVDGEPSSDARRLYRRFRQVTLRTVAAAAECVRSVSVKDGYGADIPAILSSEVRGDGHAQLFLCNLGMGLADHVEMGGPAAIARTLQFEHVRLAWKLPADWTVSEVDLDSGKIYPVKTAHSGGFFRWNANFGKLATRMFLASREAVETDPRPMEPDAAGTVRRLSASACSVRPDEPNVLVLDFPELSIDGGPFFRDYMLTADDRVRDALGVPHRSGEMVQPWMWEKTQDNSRSLNTVLRYRFECETVPPDLLLALEHPEYYELALNGTPVERRDSGWWCDHSLRRIPLPCGNLKPGANELTLSCRYHGLMCGFETVFLLGAFGVRNNVLTAQPETLVPGDWCEQGFPYYSGNMTYEWIVNLDSGPATGAFLEIPSWRGTALAVAVNGSPRIPVVHAPDRVEVSNLLRRGENRIEITVFGSRRNSHGPFYNPPDVSRMVSPRNFSPLRTATRPVVPGGLLEVPFLFQNPQKKEG